MTNQNENILSSPNGKPTESSFIDTTETIGILSKMLRKCYAMRD